jgi:hypothetical protein
MEGQVLTDAYWAVAFRTENDLARHALHSLEWVKWKRRSREPEVLAGLGWNFRQ